MTLHNSAKKGDIAKIVLMPGDPLRAKFIAETFLEDIVCFNTVRNMLGYTGTYKGKQVSVMGSGMGMPSIGIYAYELYKFYDVEKIIRIGSCGGYDESLDLLDVVIASSSYTESNFALTFNSEDTHLAYSTEELTNKLKQNADKLGIKTVTGTILTSDCFDYYNDIQGVLNRIPSYVKIVAAEMECFALFHLAKVLNKEAACMASVVDSHTKKTLVSTEDREKALVNMIKIALEVACKE